MINNQQRVILPTGENHGHHQPVSAKPSVVSVSSIDSDVSDRRDVREALYSGIFRRHRKTILVLGSFLKMLRVNRNVNNYASIKANDEIDESDKNWRSYEGLKSLANRRSDARTIGRDKVPPTGCGSPDLKSQ